MRGRVLELKPSALVSGRDMSLALPLCRVDAPLRVEQVLLTPNSVRASGFEVFEHRAGKLVPVRASTSRTVQGLVSGAPAARAAGSAMREGLSLAIDMPRGDGSFERWWLEPLARMGESSKPGLHVIYSEGDVAARGERCESGSPREAASPAGLFVAARAASTRFSASVAVEADFEYFARYGSMDLVVDRIELIYNIMNLQYERDVDIVHALSAIVVNTDPDDPYNEPDTGSMLGEMILEWNAHRTGIPRDLAHLFTGKPPLAVVGTALIGVVCTPSAYAVSNVEFNAGNLASACDIVAHETGHNWGACHCDCVSPPYTMNPTILGINRFGSTLDECDTNSVSAILAHRDSRTCLDTTVAASDPPLHDHCVNARTIDVGTWAFSNRGATLDGPPSCLAMGADVWYRYVAPADGTLTISTCGTRDASGLDSAIAVFTGDCGVLTALQCNDASANVCAGAPNFDARVSVAVARGTTYTIRIGTSPSQPGVTDLGFVNVAFSGCAAPANDLCANATPVGDGAFPFSTICAGTDGSIDDANGCDAFGYFQTGSDVWFRYAPPCVGIATVSICPGSGGGLDYDARLAVYLAPGAACPGGPFQAIACSDDACGQGPSATFAAAQGETFLVRVGGFNAAQGNGVLSLRVSPCPADLDNGNGTGVRDCGVDINDFLFFLNQFSVGGQQADLDDDGADPANPDGGVDINDLIYFLVRFEIGC